MSTTDCNSHCELAENCTSSKVKVDKVTHVWTIDNFDFCEAREIILESCEFSAFTNDRVKWQVKLRLNGVTNSKDNIGLFLSLNDKSEYEIVFAKFSFSIFDHKRKEYSKSRKTEVRQFVPGNGWGWEAFCKKDTNFRESFLLNNVLKVFCEVVFSQQGDVVVEQHHYTNTPFKSTTADFDVTENLDILLKSHLLSDVVISVQSKDYPAHKAILAAGSKIFAAMFQHDTKENQLNRVDIEDMKEEIVGEMLQFIYTGRCEKLNEFAEGLLAAADKYDLAPLKMFCSGALCKNLSIENAGRTLILADMYNATELKNKVINFIVAKPTEVFDTADWKSVLANPRLTDEVFRAAFVDVRSFVK